MECRWDRIPKSINLKGSILPSLASDLEVPKCTQYLSNMLAKWRWFTGQQATKSHPKKSKWPSGWVFLISGTCVPANGARCFGRWNSDSAKHMWENPYVFSIWPKSDLQPISQHIEIHSQWIWGKWLQYIINLETGIISYILGRWLERQNVGHTTTQNQEKTKGHFTQWSPVKPSSPLGRIEDRKRSELNHAAAHSTAKRKRRSPRRSSDTVWYSGAASCAKRDVGELGWRK